MQMFRLDKYDLDEEHYTKTNLDQASHVMMVESTCSVSTSLSDSPKDGRNWI
jgi:hypothetical protein